MTIYPETRPNWHDEAAPDAVHLGQGVYAIYDRITGGEEKL